MAQKIFNFKKWNTGTEKMKTGTQKKLSYQGFKRYLFQCSNFIYI